MRQLPEAFISYASDILADTNRGLSGNQIVTICNAYAVDFGVDIPVASYPWGDFGRVIPNKRTALKKNLLQFTGKQQYLIIKEICEYSQFADHEPVQKLKTMLIERYGADFGDAFVFETYEETGWERIDRSIAEMQEKLPLADTEEKCNAIALIGRQTEILIAREVYNPDIHGRYDGDTEIGNADAKRMLKAYLDYELNNTDKITKWVKASFDLCNQLTHDFSATHRNVAICVCAVKSLAEVIKTIEASK